MVRAMRSRGINAPVLYMSGYSDLAVENAPLLRKPFTSGMLVQAVREALETGRTPPPKGRTGEQSGLSGSGISGVVVVRACHELCPPSRKRHHTVSRRSR
jgi:hypothetical protein